MASKAEQLIETGLGLKDIKLRWVTWLLSRNDKRWLVKIEMQSKEETNTALLADGSTLFNFIYTYYSSATYILSKQTHRISWRKATFNAQFLKLTSIRCKRNGFSQWRHDLITWLPTGVCHSATHWCVFIYCSTVNLVLCNLTAFLIYILITPDRFVDLNVYRSIYNFLLHVAKQLMCFTYCVVQTYRKFQHLIHVVQTWFALPFDSYEYINK